MSKVLTGDATMRFFFSAAAAGPLSRPGANTGLLPMIGTSRPWAAATPAAEAVWPGATVSAIGVDALALKLVICERHVLVGRLDLRLDDGHAVLGGEGLGAGEAVRAVLALEVDVAELVALLDEVLVSA